MHSFPGPVARWWLVAGLFAPLIALPAILSAQSSVRQIKVIDSKGAVEIEVEASDRIVPQTQVLAGPDRLVVDFPNATPGAQLRSQSVNRGQVKDVRIGLFQSRPPITRLVLDLKTAQSYQVFPYGRTVMIKVIGAAAADTAAGVEDFPDQPQTRPGVVNANYSAGSPRVVAGRPPLEVTFRDGLLTIHASKATLSEVLFSIQQQTGAAIAIPAGAEQEKIVADVGPGAAQEVLAHLLNGSRFNFLILNSEKDPRRLDRVILTPRGESTPTAQPIVQANDQGDDDGSVNPALQAEAQAATVPPPAPPVEGAPRPKIPDPVPPPEEDPQ